VTGATRHAAHPTPRDYWLIFVILVVVTAAEVAIAYIEFLPRGVLVTSLIVLAVVKFALVALWYMHLRFDRPLYRRFFLVGLIGALSLYGVVLATFAVFG